MYIKAYEYQSFVNPIMPDIEIVSSNYKSFNYGINSIDLSRLYKIQYKATTPNLLSSFIRLNSDQNLICSAEDLDFNASSHFFYIIEGSATITFDNTHIFDAKSGDIIVSPNFEKMHITEVDEVSIYYVNDSPLLNYIGAVPNIKKIKHCCYPKEFIMENLELLSNKENNRKGILLGNEDTEKSGTMTVTHTMWSLYNELPSNTNQRVHKHNSVAIDYCVHSPDELKVYTLIGDKLDENNNIVDPIKVYWKTGTVFITPPGLWHSHHNETDESAYVLPIQDAGLLIYQRILGIVLK